MTEDENMDKEPSASGGSNPPPEQPKRQNTSMKIVGYNLLALIVYTLLSRFAATDGGAIFDMFFVAIHVFVCIIMAIVARSWVWLLSGILVLVIGFSTCVSLLSLGNMH
ncbi:hypothetical protein SAMN05428975_2506 [Mucilaginibacter sp. OK268]|uniref:hypothetical protein n=1 Tax=Mucilaginibacter sp. OK268 TaxID=1881048 RepID=UPI00089000DE|nr:hypothetical protein [Mucilaginibacter sp. OK268]SDP75119.1 hypothetical protein SAMN05428975_2506 [Mucilaginibacter sp. OK268]